MERPQAGELYRHFKGGLYQIVGIAAHSETGEELVIYQALYGDFRLYARPVSMFLGEVDHGKYPEVKQRLRFCPVSRKELAGGEAPARTAGEPSVQRPRKCRADSEREGLTEEQGMILEFLDLHSAAERIELLRAKKEMLTESVLDTLAAALDVQIEGGSVEEKLYDLLRCLEAVARFETGRMR